MISFFGIRGIGSLFYLAYALGQADFGVPAEELWAVTGFTVMVSVVLHGLTATPVMNRVDAIRDGAIRDDASSENARREDAGRDNGTRDKGSRDDGTQDDKTHDDGSRDDASGPAQAPQP